MKNKCFIFCAIFLFALHSSLYPWIRTNGEMMGSPYSQAKRWENRVYFASYPRSGNHWIRCLIEEATRVTTSSSYQDRNPKRNFFKLEYEHLPEIFPWGGYCCEHGYYGESRYPEYGECVVVKTHYPTHQSQFDELPYRAAFRVVRHPIDAFYSEFVLRYSSSGMITEESLLLQCSDWKKFQEYWDGKENVLTIRYEDLYQDPEYYLTLILELIGYPFTQEDVQRAIAKFPPEGGILKHLKHFSAANLEQMEQEIGPIMEKYGYTPTEVLSLSKGAKLAVAQE